MLIIEKMLIFLILMLVGLVLAKTKIVDDHASRKLSAIVLYVANPALVINSSQAEHTIPDAQLLVAVIVAACMYAVMIAAAAVFPKLFRLNQTQANAYAKLTVFSNIGYMGIPLISEIFGTSSLLYVSVFILFFNLLIYTYGIMVLQRGTPQAADSHLEFKKFINPGVVSGIIAVSLYLLRVSLSDLLTVPMEHLSNLTAPISMLIIGAALARVRVRAYFTDGKLFLFSLVKLLVLPIVFGYILKLCIGTGDLLNVSIVMLSVPAASMSVMMAQQYGGDIELLSRGVAITSLLCIVTIPIVFSVLL